MKVSLNLLKQFVDITHTPEELAGILNERAFEVEGIENREPLFTGVIAAQVTKIEAHPNADKLRVITLNTGTETISPVICGAWNFNEGDIVALALPGAGLPDTSDPDGIKRIILKKSKIRGVESLGMICAEEELGLGHHGTEKTIWVLDKDTVVGTDVRTLITSDIVFDLSLAANRPDLHSHLGIAREIAAVTNQPVKEPEVLTVEAQPGSEPFQVSIVDPKLCAKFITAHIAVTIGPSPKFIHDTLQTLGIRPINNVVDITNYVMIELGQPLHAFDATNIVDEMTIRGATAGEKLQAINHKEYELDPSIIVIADKKKALDIAGIMGGADTEIAPTTTKIVLTAAAFDPKSIRITSKKLGLRTDASSLFEKGINPQLMDIAMHRAFELLKEHAQGEIDNIALVDTTTPKATEFEFSIEGVNKLLGTAYTKSVVKDGLTRYGIKLSNTDILTATIPWWRTDLQDEADLAEELLKAEGINTIEPQPLALIPNESVTEELVARHMTMVKQWWARAGYNEVQNYSFVSRDDIDRFGETRPHIAIANPLSADQGYMKRHLLIPLLKNVKHNAHQFPSFRLFEVGKQFLDYNVEPWLVSGVSYSTTIPLQKQFNAIKGDCIQFLRSLGVQTITAEPFDETKSWEQITADGEVVGSVGTVESTITKQFDIDHPVVWFKFDLEKALQQKKTVRYEPVNKFPVVDRDISVIVKHDITWAHIESAIKNPQFLKQISVFEADYLATTKEGKEFHQNLAQEGNKNIGLRLTFQAPDRTLTETEITGIMGKIMLQLQQEIGATIR